MNFVIRFFIIAAALTTTLVPAGVAHAGTNVWTTHGPADGARAGSTAHAPSNGTVPLAQLLNSDGSLRAGAAGASIDGSGYRMLTAANGAPRFVPESSYAALSVPSTAVDPDAGWDSRFWRSGVEYTVYAIAFVGTDMYVGGDIPTINDTVVNGIAKWDGTSWSALGSGLNDAHNGFNQATVSTLASIGTDLYVVGEFIKAGGVSVSNIAKWDGSNWSALGSGLDGTAFGSAVIGTNLYVTGRFGKAGGITTGPIAKWDGSAWSALGAGVADPTHNSVIAHPLAVVGTDLYVGGSFTMAGGNPANFIAKWDGSSWSALGSGLPDAPNALAVMGTNLYATGRFRSIAKWDGSSWSTFSSFDGDPNTLAVNGTDLYVGGAFSNVDGITVNHAAKWDGSGWSPLGSGVNPGDYSTVNVLVVSGSNVYAGGYGDFNTASGVAHTLARWDGAQWSDLAQTSGGLGIEIPAVPRAARVDTLAVSGSNMYLAGYFTLGGDVPGNYVLKWDGSGWSALGTGMDSEVQALAVVGTALYAGGGFHTAGGVSANGIAKWDGNNWSSVGGSLDGGSDAFAVNGTDLYVGGAFSMAGSVSANNIAKWDGNNWSALGAGITGDEVDSVAFDGTNIYAGGHFSMAGSVSANSIAKWDGNNWSALGSGVKSGTDTAHTYALAVSGGDLYVGGDFNTAGGGSANRLAKWNGSSWSALGTGANADIHTLFANANDLYAGGSFDSIGGVNTMFAAKWNGSTWSALGNGINSTVGGVLSFAIIGTDLYIGGAFDTIGHKASYNFAILHPACGNGIVDIGEVCDDGNLIDGDGCDSNCTVSACGNGISAGGETCDDGNTTNGDGCSSSCQVEPCWSCNGEPSSCSLSPSGSSCEDGVFCNGTDTCAMGICQHTGDPCVGGPECNNVCDETHATCNLPFGTSCTTDGDICTDDVCDNGSCTHPNNTAPCDDGNACTVGDVCSGDVCVPGGSALNCDDSDPCTDDSCNPATGCAYTFNTAPCDDGLFCTVNDTCSNDICTGTARDCSDADSCTTDTCDEGAGTCDHGPQLICGDGFKCGNEQCDDGNTVDGDGCQANCTFTPVMVTQTVGANGTVSTGMGSGATSAFPNVTAVMTPTGGTVTISQTVTASPPVSGYGILGQQIVIDAPPATAAAPLVLIFTTDASILPPGLAVSDLQLSKNGVLLPDCTGPANQASPDPCISSRSIDPMSGDAQVVALTSTASTWATVAPAHDSVVLPVSPITITIPAGVATYSKKIKVGVLNADILPIPEVNGHTIQLAATTNCPAGVTVSAPDFDASTPAPDTSVTLAGGKSRSATVSIDVNATGIANITTVNKKAPVRCSLTFTATTTVPSANVDPVSSNDSVSVDVNFIDKHDVQQATMYESVVNAVKPVTIKVPATVATKSGTASVKVVNADFLPTVEKPGHTITVTAADGTCPLGTVGMIDYDKKTPGIQNSILLKGGAGKGKPLPLTVNPAAFHSGNAKSPARCTASVSVDKTRGDVDASNNTAHIVINVFDQHDY